MKILVLGSEGQIGKPFCEYAKTKNHELLRVDKKFKFHDLSYSPLSIETILNFNSCDVILFLAFEVGGSKFLEEKDKTFDYISENVRIMENVFSQLKKSKKPFLFTSSQMANMYHTNYGFLKDLGERYTRTLDGYISRFWNVYGEENPEDPKSHVITDFIHMAKKGEIKMRTSGEEERQFLHTDDCSEALLHWCENYQLYDKTKYLDITSFKWTSVLGIAKLIQKYIPCKIIVGNKLDKIQKGIKNSPSSYITKFWNSKVTLEEGIKKLI